MLNVLWAVILLAGVLVVSSTSPTYSVLSLCACFLGASLLLGLSGMTYLAYVYVIVYVGAIAILFLFVIQLLDLGHSEASQRYVGSLALIFVIAAYASLNSLPMDSNMWESDLVNAAISSERSSQIPMLGAWLYGSRALLLVVSSFLLLVSMVAPLLVSKR